MFKKELSKIIKFGFTGGLNTLVDFVIFTLFVEIFGVNVYISQCLGYSAGTINSYTINRKWTFGTDEKYLSLAFIKFIVLNLAMLLLSVWLLAIFRGQFAMGDYVAKICATIITMVISFIVNNLVIFKN